MANTTIWLRAETKPYEQRTPLTPADAKHLIEAGFQIMVERFPERAIADQQYQAAGCQLVASGSWPDAPQDAFILGLKELPASNTPLRHRHIYFAHAYKDQSGWKTLLQRFKNGNGKLYDLEFLVDQQQRRIAAFGQWAGFAGAALAVKTWIGQQQKQSPALKPVSAYANKDQLIDELRQSLSQLAAIPSVFIIGAKGRCGHGASQLAEALNLPIIPWDLEQTQTGGPFAEILEHPILVNCVFVQNPIPPFLTFELLNRADKKLSVIVDVSCDPYGEYNPLPIYDHCSTFQNPIIELCQQQVDLIAIDHLPSLLPLESSEDYSKQLSHHLLNLNKIETNAVWQGAEKLFQQKIAHI